MTSWFFYFKKRLWETYRAFLLHLQNIVDVILLWRASGPLPLHTQPGHPRHLQLWREGWQWHTAWGEQVHHFTELAGEGRERQRGMGENGREKTGETEWETYTCTHKMETLNGRNSHIKMDNREGAIQGIVLRAYLTPRSFLAARRKEYLEAGESLVTLYCFWGP